MAPLLFLFNVALPAQEYYALGTTFTTSHRVYRVTASGEVTIHQNLDAMHKTNNFAVDPAGRFVWMLNSSTNAPAPVYRVADDFTLSLGGLVTAASPEWGVFRPPLIVPDTSELITQTLTRSPEAMGRLEFMALNNSLVNSEIDATVDIMDLPLLSGIGVATVSTFDPQTVFLGRQVMRYDTASKEFSLTDFDAGYYAQGQDVTPDGRFFLMSTFISQGPEFAVYRVEGDGHSTITLVDSIADVDNFLTPRVVLAHPNGRFVFLVGTSSIVSVEIDPDTGEIIQVVDNVSALTSNDVTISHDGAMLFQATNRFGGIADMVPYCVNPDGTLDRLSNGLEVPYSTSDLAFLPPKTPPTLLGDANVDGQVDAADVVTVVEMAQPTARLAPPQQFANADMDRDVDVDFDDLDLLIEMLLGLP